MKRIVSLFMALALLLLFIPAEVSAATVRPNAPSFMIQSNRLYLDGNQTSTSYIFLRYDFLLIRASDYSPSILSQLDVDNILSITASALLIVPGAENVLTETTLKAYPNPKVPVAFGDVILARDNGSITGKASQWCVITLHPSMFTPASASSEGDLPKAADVTVTDSILSFAPSNIYTRYEYSIIPAKPSPDFTPEWIAMGAASDRSSDTLTANFLPYGTPYTICIRIEGDDKQGFLYTAVAGVPVTAPKVLFSLEKLGPLSGGEAGSTWYFSSNGGKKWETITVEPNEDAYIDLSKVFSKKDVPYQLKQAAPITDENGEAAVTPPEASAAILSGTFKPRPAFPKTLVVSAFVSKQYPENWTLTGSRETLEYSEDGVEWTPLRLDVGLPLLTAEQQSSGVKPTAYKIRIAPAESAALPASAPKKFAQVKQIKAPNAKPDYKKETIKIKNGLKYSVGEAGLPIDSLTFSVSAGEPIEIEDAISNRQVIYVYTPENGKKSRSAIQTVILAERAESPDDGEGLTISKSSLSLAKGFEYYGSKEKWGSFTKGDTKGMLRRKATAKYNAKTNTNTGLAASRPVKCEIAYSADGKSVQSLSMEQKKKIPLQSWNIASTNGGYVSSNASGNPVIVANEYSGTVSFTVSPSFASGDKDLVESFSVAVDSEEITPANGIYTLSNMSVGGAVTLTIFPKDRDTYGKSVYTVDVIAPQERSPYSVSFGSEGSYGNVTVTLSSSTGQARALNVDLVRVPEEKLIYQTQTAVGSSQVNYDKVVFDFKQALMDAGPGTYELRAYFAGGAETSDSPPVKTSRTFDKKEFGVTSFNLTAPDNLRPGDIITVTSLRDGFGNDLTAGSTYQWYRIANGTRYTISSGGNTASYTLTQEDIWHYIEVVICSNGIYYTQTIYKQVQW